MNEWHSTVPSITAGLRFLRRARKTFAHAIALHSLICGNKFVLASSESPCWRKRLNWSGWFGLLSGSRGKYWTRNYCTGDSSSNQVCNLKRKLNCWHRSLDAYIEWNKTSQLGAQKSIARWMNVRWIEMLINVEAIPGSIDNSFKAPQKTSAETLDAACENETFKRSAMSTFERLMNRLTWESRSKKKHLGFAIRLFNLKMFRRARKVNWKWEKNAMFLMAVRAFVLMSKTWQFP